MQVNSEKAETVALQALVWILEDDELTTRFLGMSGADPQMLRQNADSAEVLCSVMDFILTEDKMVLEFAGAVNVPPETVVAARHSLPGGEQVHWT